MFISGIWSQITTAIHTRTIWFDLDERGNHIQHMYSVAKDALNTLKTLSPKAQRAAARLIDSGEAAILGCKELDGLDGVATFGCVWNYSEHVKILKAWIAELDCYSAIASLDGICFPTIRKTVGLKLTGVHHPFVKGCISNNYSTEGHSILTGPNRGGKSTYCKSVGLAVVTAQTWGFAWADKMSFSPFATIVTALEPAGLLGSMSTFEAEIEFAKSVLAASGLPMFVMMDEIFHSTNAGDGLEASRVFMRQLYKRKQIISMISTHYKDLAESFGELATAIQMEATDGTNGSLVYSYKVIPGISDKSSVMEILQERGLLSA
jgi:DNA mismatch repair ATPase MutS